MSPVSSRSSLGRAAIAAVVVVVEYLALSFLFDARDLVSASLELGEIAPMPIIAGVAFLILRASASSVDPLRTSADPVGASAAAVPRATLGVLLVLHACAYAAFLAMSFALRDQQPDAPLTSTIAWVALGALTMALLAVFAFARSGMRELAKGASGPLGLAALVGVAAWAAGQGTGELWHPLSRLTLWPVSAIVGAISPDRVVHVDQFVVGTERFAVRIDPVCSGYEGMGLVAVLLGAFVWTHRRTLRFPHVLAVVLLAVVGAFVANVVRITSLIYVGTLGSADVAVNGFHSKAGWLVYCVVALAATYIARHARVFQREPSRSGSHEATEAHDNPSAAYLVPLLALVAGSFVGGLASTGALDHLEVVSIASAGVALAVYRRAVREALTGPASSLGVITGVVVFIVWIAIDAVSSDVETRRTAEAAVQTQVDAWSTAAMGLWIAARLVVSVAIVPIVEELAFRGFLMRRIVAADFTSVSYRSVSALAVIASSAAFGALHGLWIAGILAGLAYAAVVWRTGRLRDAVVAHLVTNALIAITVLAFGRWSLW